MAVRGRLKKRGRMKMKEDAQKEQMSEVRGQRAEDRGREVKRMKDEGRNRGRRTEVGGRRARWRAGAGRVSQSRKRYEEGSGTTNEAFCALRYLAGGLTFGERMVNWRKI